MAKRAKNASTASLAEIADALEEARRREAWKKEKKEGERHCTTCGQPYKPSRSWQVYCSDPCRISAFQAKVSNHEQKLLGRVMDLEKENEQLRKKVQELESAIQRACPDVSILRRALRPKRRSCRVLLNLL
jgi:protein-arginine kinase activator protein McsA